MGGKEIVARIFVVPSDDFDEVRDIGGAQITSYLTVGAYAKFQEWLGRGPALSRCGTRGPRATAPGRSSSCPTR